MGSGGNGSGSGAYYNALGGIQDELRALEMRRLELEDTKKCRSLILAELEEATAKCEEKIAQARMANTNAKSKLQASRLKKERLKNRVAELSGMVESKHSRMEILNAQMKRVQEQSERLEAKYKILIQQNYVQFLEVPIIRECKNAKLLVNDLTEELEQCKVDHEQKQQELIAVRQKAAETWNSFVGCCIKLAETRAQTLEHRKKIKDAEKGKNAFAVTKRAPLMELQRQRSLSHVPSPASSWRSSLLAKSQSTPITPRFVGRRFSLGMLLKEQEPVNSISDSISGHLESEPMSMSAPEPTPTAETIADCPNEEMPEPEFENSEVPVPLAKSPAKSPASKNSESIEAVIPDTPTRLMPPPPPPLPLEPVGLESMSKLVPDLEVEEMPLAKCPPAASSFFNESDGSGVVFTMSPPASTSTSNFWDPPNENPEDDQTGDGFFSAMFSNSSSFGFGGNGSLF